MFACGELASDIHGAYCLGGSSLSRFGMFNSMTGDLASGFSCSKHLGIIPALLRRINQMSLDIDHSKPDRLKFEWVGVNLNYLSQPGAEQITLAAMYSPPTKVTSANPELDARKPLSISESEFILEEVGKRTTLKS